MLHSSRSPIWLLILLALINHGNGALFQAKALVHPDFPDKCWSEHLGEAFAVGELWREPPCFRVQCYLRGLELYTEYASCGVIGGPPGCIEVQDFTKEYPDCCPQLDCSNLIDYRTVNEEN